MEIFLIFVTIVSIATAGVALTMARRATLAERLRSQARVAALAAAADAHPRETGSTFEGGSWTPAAEPDHLFATVRRPDEGPNASWLAVGALVVLAVIGVVSAVAIRGGGGNPEVSPSARSPQPQLELVTLAHTQEMRALVITGTVRNPSAGTRLEGLTAVISLLDRSGALIATKDVPLDYRALAPGEEAPFTLSLPDRGAIERYRVSFRTGTDIVPHVDRRSEVRMSGGSHVTT